MCIRPILSYSSAVFAQASSAQINRLQVIQNRFLRMATGAPWFMRNIDLHSDLQLESIRGYFKETSKRFFEIASGHPNPLIASAANYNPDQLYNNFKGRRPKQVLADDDDDITTHVRHTTLTRKQAPGVAAAHRPRRRRRGRSPNNNPCTDTDNHGLTDQYTASDSNTDSNPHASSIGFRHLTNRALMSSNLFTPALTLASLPTNARESPRPSEGEWGGRPP